MGETTERKGRRAPWRGVAAGVFHILRSFLLLFSRRRAKDISPNETATRAPPGTASTVTTSTPETRKAMNPGFDMQTEIAKLAERIIEPVAPKLTAQERGQVAGQIRSAFEQLHIRRAADADFENIAVNILESVRPRLTEAECARIVDRLRGAMHAFCQVDLGEKAA
jgi:hypothetical protein